MTVSYADTSALARCYFSDEPESAELRASLLASGEAVLASELALVELRSAVAAAVRAQRLRRPTPTLLHIRQDLIDGRFRLVPVTSAIVSDAATLVERHPLRTLDALHLATALSFREALGTDDPVVFVTRDHAQADAARAEGLTVA